jgi:hypothetical protein
MPALNNIIDQIICWFIIPLGACIFDAISEKEDVKLTFFRDRKQYSRTLQTQSELIGLISPRRKARKSKKQKKNKFKVEEGISMISRMLWYTSVYT